MSFSQSGSSITQSGTDSSLAGLSGIAGVTVTTIGNVTAYTIDSNNLIVTGTLTMNPLTELLINTSTTISDLLYINGGTLNVGTPVIPSFGHGRENMYPKQTAVILGKDGPGCCSAGPLTISSTGTLNMYGAIFNINGCWSINSGAKWVVRDCIVWSHNDDGNTRMRCSEGTGLDIIGLETYGIQFDWLLTEAFTNFLNFKPLNKGIPIENATGTPGLRSWRVMPDNTYATDALMNNWNAVQDVVVTLAEVGSRIMIVPDSVSSTTAHGGRLYHEFIVSCFDVLNNPIEDALCYVADYDNGMRITTDTTTTPSSITEGDQILTPLTKTDGQTDLQTILTAMYYRTDTVSDLTSPNGLEKCDYRGKPKVVTSAITSSSGVSGTFISSDNSLPTLAIGTRFVLSGSTSNDGQIWETTGVWTTAGGDADRLSTNSTNETEKTMSMSVYGEDNYDVYVWSYGHLPYKFTDASMKGTELLNLNATMIDDLAITQTVRATVASYTTIADLNEFYDVQKDYKVDPTNVTKPDVGTALVTANGTELDLGANELVVTTTGNAFSYSANEITINVGV